MYILKDAKQECHIKTCVCLFQFSSVFFMIFFVFFPTKVISIKKINFRYAHDKVHLLSKVKVT